MTSMNNITLYYRPTCPFCIRVKHYLSKNKLIVNEKNVSTSNEALSKLILEGGKRQVPAITIRDEGGSEHWLYESSDIIKAIDTIVKTKKTA